jgi:hypothetical protein
MTSENIVQGFRDLEEDVGDLVRLAKIALTFTRKLDLPGDEELARHAVDLLAQAAENLKEKYYAAYKGRAA